MLQFYSYTECLELVQRDQGRLFLTGTALCINSVKEFAWPTRRAGSQYKLPGPKCAVYVFVFPVSIITRQLYQLTLSDQAHVTLHLRVSLSNLVILCQDF
jgi:hypothetical protein